MEDKEIDLGEGCKITIKQHETGSRDFCLNCDGEEQMTFSYNRKGTEVLKTAERVFDKVLDKGLIQNGESFSFTAKQPNKSNDYLLDDIE